MMMTSISRAGRLGDVPAIPESRLKRQWRVIRRSLAPQFVAQLYYLWKHRAFVSRRAEVEIADSTEWGPGCVIGSFTKVKISGRFVMGCRVQIGTNCFIG